MSAVYNQEAADARGTEASALAPIYNPGIHEDPPMTRPIMHRLSTVLLLVAIAAGAFLRLSDIGRDGFWTDELFHVFAAKSYLEDGSFRVPWEPKEYTRALPITFITALSFKLFGQSEASARIGSALVNILFIFIGYRVLRALFSRNVALIFALATSFSVLSIFLSRECRMYTLFQLCYFLMSISFFQGLECNGSVRLPRERKPVAYLVASLGLAIFAASLHGLTYNFAFVVLAYCGTMFFYEGRRLGLRESLYSKYAAVLLVMALGGMVLVLFRADFVSGMFSLATELPNWKRPGESGLGYYHRVLTDSHRVLWTIYPLGAFLAIQKYGRKGLFFVLSFIVLLFMHCFVFYRSADRYIFYIFPFFVAVAAISGDFLLGAGKNLISDYGPLLPSWQRRMFTGAVCASLLLVAHDWIGQTVADTSVVRYVNWKDLDPVLVQTISRGTTMTTDRLRFTYYFERYPDFVLGVDDVPADQIVTNLEQFKEALSRHPDLYFVTHRLHISSDAFVSPEIKEFISRELERIDQEGDGRIMVFMAGG